MLTRMSTRSGLASTQRAFAVLARPPLPLSPVKSHQVAFRVQGLIARAASTEQVAAPETAEPVARRESDHMISRDSGVDETASAIFEKLQGNAGAALVIDADGVESLTKAAYTLVKVAELANAQQGQRITVQPFGRKTPMGFLVNLMPSGGAVPPEPEKTTFVSRTTPVKNLETFVRKIVLEEQGSVVLQSTGYTPLSRALLSVAHLRDNVERWDLAKDAYISVLSAKEIGDERPNKNGSPSKLVQCRIGVYPCGRTQVRSPAAAAPTEKADAATENGDDGTITFSAEALKSPAA